jgi:2-C-methyl-D-erythritol 4-phosphate cytidylyltransferase
LIVLAAGGGSRLGLDVPKAFAPLAGRTILEHALASAFDPARVDALVVVVPAGWEERAREIAGPEHAVVTGGPSRQASVRAALAAVPPRAGTIVIHDAARPLTHPAFFLAILRALEGWDGAVPVAPVTDTVKRLEGERVVGTEPRAALGLAQTPQAFRGEALRDAHARAEQRGDAVTDDAEAVELAGYRVRAIAVDAANFKITTPEDLARAEAVLAQVAHG